MSKAALHKAKKLREKFEQMKVGAPPHLLYSIEASMKELDSLIKKLEAKQYYKAQKVKVPENMVYTRPIKSISITATVVFGD